MGARVLYVFAQPKDTSTNWFDEKFKSPSRLVNVTKKDVTGVLLFEPIRNVTVS